MSRRDTLAPPAVPQAPRDPYALDPSEMKSRAVSLFPTLRRIGPGMVLAASIVGSGELIATTTLGAQVGYTALWLMC